MATTLPRRALISVTSYNGVFYANGGRTGLFYTEALHPFLALAKADFDVELASETGTYGLDEHSLDKQFLSDEDEAILRNPKHPFNVKLNSQLRKASAIDKSAFGLFFASAGHATLYDYPKARGLQSIAEDIWSRGGVVSAVCHGPAILPGIVDRATGKSIIAGKSVTGFTTEGEIVLNLLDRIRQDRVETIEEAAAKVGAKYVAPPRPFDDFSITDGRIVTGANPASAHSTAAKAIAAFDAL